MLVYLGMAMKQYLVLVGRRTLNGYSIVGRGRSLASIPILLCALMLLFSACGGRTGPSRFGNAEPNSCQGGGGGYSPEAGKGECGLLTQRVRTVHRLGKRDVSQ